MKLVTASNGKQTIKMSKKDWRLIGKKAGWIKTSNNWAIVQENNENLNNKQKFIEFMIEYCNLIIKSNRATKYHRIAGSFINTLNACSKNLSSAYMDSGYAYDDDDPRNKMIDRDDDEAKFGDFGIGDEDERIKKQIEKETVIKICEFEISRTHKKMNETFGNDFSNEVNQGLDEMDENDENSRIQPYGSAYADWYEMMMDDNRYHDDRD